MSDFAQSGLICTLQRLNESHLDQLEAELATFTEECPIGLVLPCHGRDLTQPALTHLIKELCGATWLREVIVSLNGVDDAAVKKGTALFSNLPFGARLMINNDSNEGPAGKGKNVYRATQVFASEGNCGVIATQDCDVASFRRQDLARLCYAVVHPAMRYRYAKMYYSRVTDRLYGRVSRLFLAPFLRAILRIGGHKPILDFLLSFRYPLAGEVAMDVELARALPPSHGWGLEIGQLCEVFRRIDPRETCQVDGGTGYDHKHQPALTALTAMSAEIAQEVFRQMESEGMKTTGIRQWIAKLYKAEAEHAMRRSQHLALMNGLPFDEAAEREMIEAFARQLELSKP